MTDKRICPHCMNHRKGKCECDDYLKCRDCPMPRKVLILERLGREY